MGQNRLTIATWPEAHVLLGFSWRKLIVRREGALMGFFLILVVVVVLLALANLATVLSLQRWKAGPGWWVALWMAWLIGAAVGVWSGFYFEYQPSPHLRVFGAPVPAVFFQLEEGPAGEEQWIDFITPAPLLYAGSNVPILTMLTAGPVGILFWVRSRNERRRMTQGTSG